MPPTSSPTSTAAHSASASASADTAGPLVFDIDFDYGACEGSDEHMQRGCTCAYDAWDRSLDDIETQLTLLAGDNALFGLHEVEYSFAFWTGTKLRLSVALEYAFSGFIEHLHITAPHDGKHGMLTINRTEHFRLVMITDPVKVELARSLDSQAGRRPLVEVDRLSTAQARLVQACRDVDIPIPGYGRDATTRSVGAGILVNNMPDLTADYDDEVIEVAAKLVATSLSPLADLLEAAKSSLM